MEINSRTMADVFQHFCRPLKRPLTSSDANTNLRCLLMPSYAHADSLTPSNAHADPLMPTDPVRRPPRHTQSLGRPPEAVSLTAVPSARRCSGRGKGSPPPLQEYPRFHSFCVSLSQGHRLSFLKEFVCLF